MRKFGFIIALFQKNLVLAHNKLKGKFQVGDAEHLTKAKFSRTLAKEMLESENGKRKRVKNI